MVSNLQAEYNVLQNRIEVMYEDRLDGSLPKDEYDNKVKDYRQKQAEILKQLEIYKKTDESYYLKAEKILQLANRAIELFVSSEIKLKHQLLKFYVQNLRLNAEKLEITLQEPFNSISKLASCNETLQLVNIFRTYEPKIMELEIPDFVTDIISNSGKTLQVEGNTHDTVNVLAK